MGVVYVALDDRLWRQVAIKTIRPANTDTHARERLWREARAAARVSHPNICQIYEVGEDGDELFLVMELLEGETLADRIAGEPLSLPKATQTALAVLAALDALHRRGIMHRDLKPAEVFLSPVGLKLLDFGLARPIETVSARTEPDLTQPGTIIAPPPQYLAPEQLLGRPVDARSNIFAAGAVLFEMLTGTRPFDGDTLPQVTHAVAYEQPPVLGGSPAIATVDRIVHWALRNQPDERYQTVTPMAEDLRVTTRVADSGDSVRAVPMTRLMVMPFRTLRPDPETDFLAFSLPDDLTTTLSGIDPLIVRSSVTASRFASEAPYLDAIGSEANVDVVLTGTLLRAGDEFRVNTQLVEAPGGTVLWSQSSRTPVGDIFALQDELTSRIVDSLAAPLGVHGENQPQKDVPDSAKAYEFYLRANQIGSHPSTWTVARDLYLQCLEEAPGSRRPGRVWAGSAS